MKAANVRLDPALLKRCREYVPQVPRGIPDPLSAVVTTAVRAFLDYDLDGVHQATVLANYCHDVLQGRERVQPNGLFPLSVVRDLDSVAREVGVSPESLIRASVIRMLQAPERDAVGTEARILEARKRAKAAKKAVSGRRAGTKKRRTRLGSRTRRTRRS